MTSPVVTRAQAGLRAPRSVSTNITPGEGVTFHYGGTALGGFPWPHSRCPSIWRAWQAYHMDAHGWADIAYNAGACPHGYIFEGRWWGVRSAANGTAEANRRSYAIVYMAGEGEPLTAGGKRALTDARGRAMGDRSRPASGVVRRHSDWRPTPCPGPVNGWIDEGMPRPGDVDNPPAPGRLAAPASAMARTPSGAGYMVACEDGGVFTYGDARFHGSLPGLGVKPNTPIVGVAVTPSGGGYWLVGEDGGVFSFGDALYRGGMGDKALNAPIVAIVATGSGGGYWLLAEDGGVFSFGDAPFHGRPGA